MLGVGRSSAHAVVIAAACVALVGCRQDMHDAPSYDPLQETSFFANGAASRTLVANTVARGQLRADEHLYTGKVNGQAATEFPMPVTKDVLDRGQERFNVYCSPCHGRTGEGNGMIVQRGFRAAAVVPRGAAAQCAGRLFLRRHDERLRRDAGLFGAGHRARSLGDCRVHPRAAAQSVRRPSTMCRPIAAAISIALQTHLRRHPHRRTGNREHHVRSTRGRHRRSALARVDRRGHRPGRLRDWLLRECRSVLSLVADCVSAVPGHHARARWRW